MARPIVDVQAPRMDPLARLEDDQVLRCRDPETDWLWFYDTDGGDAVRYHERDEFAARPTARTIVAETVAIDSVEVTEVSRAHLDVRTEGER